MAMTEAEFLKIARAFRDLDRRFMDRCQQEPLEAESVRRWWDELAEASLMMSRGARALEDPDPGVEPEWVTTPPPREGWYWVRWNGGEPYLMASWWEGGHHCYAPVTQTSVYRAEGVGIGLEWWPRPIRRPGEREEKL